MSEKYGLQFDVSDVTNGLNKLRESARRAAQEAAGISFDESLDSADASAKKLHATLSGMIASADVLGKKTSKAMELVEKAKSSPGADTSAARASAIAAWEKEISVLERVKKVAQEYNDIIGKSVGGGLIPNAFQAAKESERDKAKAERDASRLAERENAAELKRLIKSADKELKSRDEIGKRGAEFIASEISSSIKSLISDIDKSRSKSEKVEVSDKDQRSLNEFDEFLKRSLAEDKANAAELKRALKTADQDLKRAVADQQSKLKDALKQADRELGARDAIGKSGAEFISSEISTSIKGMISDIEKSRRDDSALERSIARSKKALPPELQGLMDEVVRDMASGARRAGTNLASEFIEGAANVPPIPVRDRQRVRESAGLSLPAMSNDEAERDFNRRLAESKRTGADMTLLDGGRDVSRADGMVEAEKRAGLLRRTLEATRDGVLKVGAAGMKAGGAIAKGFDTASFSAWKLEQGIGLIVSGFQGMMTIAKDAELILGIGVAWEQTSEKAGVSLEALRKATNNTIGDAELKKMANFGAAAGIQGDSLVKFAERARVAAKLKGASTQEFFERFVNMTAKQEKEIGDEMTVKVRNATKIWKDAAKELGKKASELTEAEKSTAYEKEVLRASSHLAVGGDIEKSLGGENLDRVQQAQASINNLFDEGKVKLLEMMQGFGLFDSATKAIDEMSDALGMIVSSDSFHDVYESIKSIVAALAEQGLSVIIACGPALADMAVMLAKVFENVKPLIPAISTLGYILMRLAQIIMGSTVIALGIMLLAVKEVIDLTPGLGYAMGDLDEKIEKVGMDLVETGARGLVEWDLAAKEAIDTTERLSSATEEAGDGFDGIRSAIGGAAQDMIDFAKATDDSAKALENSAQKIDEFAQKAAALRGELEKLTSGSRVDVESKLIKETEDVATGFDERAKKIQGIANQALENKGKFKIDSTTSESDIEALKELGVYNEGIEKALKWSGSVEVEIPWDKAQPMIEKYRDAADKTRGLLDTAIDKTGEVENQANALKAVEDAAKNKIKLLGNEATPSHDVFESITLNADQLPALVGGSQDMSSIKASDVTDMAAFEKLVKDMAYDDEGELDQSKIKSNLKSLHDDINYLKKAEDDLAKEIESLASSRTEFESKASESFKVESAIGVTLNKLEEESNRVATLEAQIKNAEVAAKAMENVIYRGAVDADHQNKLAEILRVKNDAMAARNEAAANAAALEAEYQSLQAQAMFSFDPNAANQSFQAGEAQRTAEQQANLLRIDREQREAALLELQKYKGRGGRGRKKKEDQMILPELLDTSAGAFGEIGRFSEIKSKMLGDFQARLSADETGVILEGHKESIEKHRERIKGMQDQYLQMSASLVNMMQNAKTIDDFNAAADQYDALKRSVEAISGWFPDQDKMKAVDRKAGDYIKFRERQNAAIEKIAEMTRAFNDDREETTREIAEIWEDASIKRTETQRLSDQENMGEYGNLIEMIPEHYMENAFGEEYQLKLAEMKRAEDAIRKRMQQEKERIEKEFSEARLDGAPEAEATRRDALSASEQKANEELSLVAAEREGLAMQIREDAARRWLADKRETYSNLGKQAGEVLGDGIGQGFGEAFVFWANDSYSRIKSWADMISELMGNLFANLGGAMAAWASAEIMMATGNPFGAALASAGIIAFSRALGGLFQRKMVDADVNKIAEKELKRKREEREEKFTVTVINNGLAISARQARELGETIATARRDRAA